MILEIDAGNTRIKWRLLGELVDGSVKKKEGFVLADQAEVSAVLTSLGEQFQQLPMSQVSWVRASNVRGQEFANDLSIWMNKEWRLPVQFAQVRSPCGDVAVCYADPGKLGVDRWLAMLAAFKAVQRSCCVVDCGSAITIDVIDDDGAHLGGYIVPGFQLLQKVLVDKSGVLEASESSIYSLGLGQNTGAAIRNGALAMVVSLIDKVCQRQILNKDAGASSVACFLSGGDADLVSPYIAYQHDIVPDIVMDGLSIAMGKAR